MKIFEVNERVRRVIARSGIGVDDVMSTLSLEGETAKSVRSNLTSLWHNGNYFNPTRWFRFFRELVSMDVFPALCRESVLFRRFLVGEVDNLTENARLYYGAATVTDNPESLSDAASIIHYINSVMKGGALREAPELQEALNKLSPVFKEAWPGKSGVLSMLWAKTLSLVPPACINPVDRSPLDSVMDVLYRMVPSGADPLHAAMYIQKTVKTVKDLRLVAGGVTVSAPYSGGARFWLSKSIGLYIDFMFLHDNHMQFHTSMTGCAATLSCPGQPSLKVSLLGYLPWEDSRSQIHLPEETGSAWFDAFMEKTVTVHVDQWNLELDRDETV